MTNDIATILAQHKLRVTKPRLAVFKTLQSASRPLSQVEIAQQNPEIDVVSVYRTIDLFLRLEVVVGVAHGWKQRYELAAPFLPHHHHLLCTECGRVEGVQSDMLEQIIHMLADQHRFEVTGHTFEIVGVCSGCR